MTPNQPQEAREAREANDNRGYQEQLAHNLLDCLGREGAIHACQANAWDGVLDFLLPRDQEA